jgi:excisionase family DNA binding protein
MIDQKLTVKQVAEIFQISEQIVQKWAREGKIPHYRVGFGKSADYRFDEKTLIEYFKAPKTKMDFDDIH